MSRILKSKVFRVPGRPRIVCRNPKVTGIRAGPLPGKGRPVQITQGGTAGDEYQGNFSYVPSIDHASLRLSANSEGILGSREAFECALPLPYQ